MAGTAVVTDGTDSFYGSRLIFQTLFDHGDYDKITALSTSVADAKKMLMSRQARYSGLTDVLTFSEGPLVEAMAGASAWVAVNAKASKVAEMAQAAATAGVKRAFIHLCSDDEEDASLDGAALESALGASGLEYTIMRTGSLAEKTGGAGLKLGELCTPVCGEVSKDETFRFITEALTLPEAAARSFALCPSVDDSQLREMRFAGCGRREEVEALLKGVISEKEVAEAVEEKSAEEKSTEETAAAKEEEATREEELKALLARAKERGVEFQKKMKEEEDAKKAAREERAMYFKSPEKPEGEGGEGGEDPPPPAAEEGAKEEKKKDDDDDDGLALA